MKQLSQVMFLQASTVKELTGIKHSLLADAFCPTVIRMENEPAIRRDLVNKGSQPLAEWYAELLDRCKRRTQAPNSDFPSDSFGGDPLEAYVEAQEQTDGFEQSEFAQTTQPKFDDGFGRRQTPTGAVMSDPWARR
jgi:hypothetical protein